MGPGETLLGLIELRFAIMDRIGALETRPKPAAGAQPETTTHTRRAEGRGLRAAQGGMGQGCGRDAESLVWSSYPSHAHAPSSLCPVPC